MRTRIGVTASALALVAAIPLAAGAAAQDESVTLTLLHNNDGESSLQTLGYGQGEDGPTLEVGGAAAFKTVTDREIADARAAGNSVVNVYAGDSFLPSALLACSAPEDSTSTEPVYDAIAQSQIPYDVHVMGNHEFDYGPDFLQRFIQGFVDGETLTQPFISANLDFAGEAGFASLIDADGVIETPVADNAVIGSSVVVTDAETGAAFGVVGATTERLPIISSPRDIAVSEAVPAIQAQVDALTAAGIDKIIFVSHLQGIDTDQEVIAQLSGVDVAVAGGGDELLVNDASQLLPGEDPEDIYGAYPIFATAADGAEVPIVTTAGNYKYLGRLDVTFDADGNVTGVVEEASFPRRVIPTAQDEAGILDALGVTDAVDPDPGIISSVLDPVAACLQTLRESPVAISEVVLNVDRGQYSAEDGVFSPGVRSSQTNGGTIIADSFLAAYEAYAGNVGLDARSADNLVVVLQNGGGIRQNAGPVLPVGGNAGEAITQLNTIDVLPFLNYVVAIQDLTVEDFAATLQTACESRGGGGFMQAAAVSYTCDYTGDGPVLRDVTIDAGDGTTVTVVDADGVVDTSVGPIDVITNSFTAGGGDGYEAFGAADNVTLRADDDGQVTYERAFREFLASLPAGDDGVPVISADIEAYANEQGDGRITLIDP
jgi:5'-nucleotidase